MNKTSVPHLESISDVSELTNHYKPLGGKVTMGSEGFIVRLPDQKRIHFYEYDAGPGPIQSINPYIFKSEGFYDEFSPYWDGPAATAAVVAEHKTVHAKQRAERYADGIKLTQPLDGPESVPNYAFVVVRTVKGCSVAQPGEPGYAENSRLFQFEDERDSLAEVFGWNRKGSALNYLSENVGKVVADPGYFG